MFPIDTVSHTFAYFYPPQNIFINKLVEQID